MPSDPRYLNARRLLPALQARLPTLVLADGEGHLATNWVTFGQLGDRPVVIKSYTQLERWRNELACLRHFAPSGLVPAVLDADSEGLLVSERLDGDDFWIAAKAAAALDRSALSHAIGHGLGILIRTPLPHHGDGYSVVRDFAVIPWHRQPSLALQRFVDTGTRIAGLLPSYRDAIFERSLLMLSSQLATIDQRPRCLVHEDIANCKVDGLRFTGFFDFEMCRIGPDALQLGVALHLCTPGGLHWSSLRRGLERALGAYLSEQDLQAAIAMYHAYAWIRICRWGWWDGDPAQEHHRQESLAECDDWRRYLSERMSWMRDEGDLAQALAALHLDAGS